jgi:hypothetical protein
MKPCLLTLASLLLSFPLFADADLDIQEPWIREAPPTASVLAAYMVINNHGDSPAEITAITSPDFDHTELHQTRVEDGMARMVPVKRLEIPAAGTVSLEPGGMHLMLFTPKRPLREGDSVTLVILQRNGDPVTVKAPVLRKTGGMDHQHHHHE